MQLSELFSTSHIATDLSSHTKSELFHEMAELLAASGAVSDAEKVVDALFQRESVMNTQIAPHIALPHASLWNFGRTVGAFGVSRRGVDYGSQDGGPVHIVVMLLDDRYAADEHLATIKSVGRMAGSPNFVGKMLECTSTEEIRSLIAAVERMIQK